MVGVDSSWYVMISFSTPISLKSLILSSTVELQPACGEHLKKHSWTWMLSLKMSKNVLSQWISPVCKPILILHALLLYLVSSFWESYRSVTNNKSLKAWQFNRKRMIRKRTIQGELFSSSLSFLSYTNLSPFHSNHINEEKGTSVALLFSLLHRNTP